MVCIINDGAELAYCSAVNSNRAFNDQFVGMPPRRNAALRQIPIKPNPCLHLTTESISGANDVMPRNFRPTSGATDGESEEAEEQERSRDGEATSGSEASCREQN
jgi:hypothetical protein